MSGARTACTDNRQDASLAAAKASTSDETAKNDPQHVATPTGRVAWLGASRHGAVEVRTEDDGYVLWLTVGDAPPLRYAADANRDRLWAVGVGLLEGLRR